MEALVRETRDFQKPDLKETIDMVISAPNDPTQLSRFMLQLEKTCKGCNHSAGIIGSCGSCGRGACVTISLVAYSPLEIVNEISNMPEVEIVEEDQPNSGVFSRFFSLFARKPLSYYNSNKRFSVILNGTDKERWKLETVSDKINC